MKVVDTNIHKIVIEYYVVFGNETARIAFMTTTWRKILNGRDSTISAYTSIHYKHIRGRMCVCVNNWCGTREGCWKQDLTFKQITPAVTTSFVWKSLSTDFGRLPSGEGVRQQQMAQTFSRTRFNKPIDINGGIRWKNNISLVPVKLLHVARQDLWCKPLQ